MLRIRDNATIREIKIPADIKEVLHKILQSNDHPLPHKHAKIKQLTNASPCCVCGGLPELEVIYKLEDASKIERYCQVCIK